MSRLNSSIAGSWYPADAAELREMLDRYRAEIEPEERREEASPDILILPHAGYIYSARTAMYGISQLRRNAFRRVVILAPSHRSAFADRLIAPEVTALGTPLGDIPVDTEAIDRVGSVFPVSRNNLVHAAEHATQIEYPLLQYALGEFRVVPFVVGDFSSEGELDRAGAALRQILEEGTLLVISSDFTHYGQRFGFAPFGRGRAAARQVREVDLQAFEAIREGDCAKFETLLDRTCATICGRNPIRLMLHCIPKGTRFELLHYSTSIEETGDDSDFVCYLCGAGYAAWPAKTQTAQTLAAQKTVTASKGAVAPAGAEMNEEYFSEEERRTLLGMARRSIEHALRTGRVLPEDAFQAEATEKMRKKMGCFVTLNRRSDGSLRGCIGEIEPYRPLYRAVTARAIDAAFRDPRFRPMSMAEWGDVKIEISALTPAHPVSSWQEIEIGRHGMTLSKNGRMAVFLPQVAPEQGWDLETTLSHLALKAGLRADDWREGASFTVFEAIVFHEA